MKHKERNIGTEEEGTKEEMGEVIEDGGKRRELGREKGGAEDRGTEGNIREWERGTEGEGKRKRVEKGP